MGEFPPELLFEILLRLPPEDLLRCLCVSKAWNTTIHDKNFIKSHLQRSIQTNSFGSLFVSATFSCKKCLFKFSDIYNDGTIERAMKMEQPPLQDAESQTPFPSTLVSSNGIICIRTERDEDEDFVLWNPSIRKFKKIPSPTFEQSPSSDKHMYLGYGFGYDSTNDDYKLLGITNFNMAMHQYEIYSLKSNSWRKIRNMPCEFHMIVSRILFSNGALSWLAQNMLDIKMHVVTFELASKKYHWFPTPVDENVHTEVLGDSLCIFRLRTIDAWIMKERGSWTLPYSIEQAAMSWVSWWEPVLLSKNGGSVLLMNDLQKFAWFDLVKNSWKEVETTGLYLHFIYTICMRSLCLLDGDPIIVESSKSLSL
ncbi:F-box protein CPR30-like [Pyrus ussuriensis x Pyrus communis]|uniref:F-box protein CPR30-like n=1 Tax=Pyrus ussuriensis x Pyrus communis TaxID=2448454 RepID=A0A5N5HKU1_9ROSA|nr:F-box protein CPR30-like [Pyrus ussuriensis x Pyrus communis]